jgi:hypothetical protein
MEYKFARVYRGYEIGASVPKDYTPGIIDLLLRRGIVEPVTKAILAPPKNKMVKRKAVSK